MEEFWRAFLGKQIFIFLPLSSSRCPEISLLNESGLCCCEGVPSFRKHIWLWSNLGMRQRRKRVLRAWLVLMMYTQAFALVSPWSAFLSSPYSPIVQFLFSVRSTHRQRGEPSETYRSYGLSICLCRRKTASIPFLSPSPNLVQGLSLSGYSIKGSMNELITLSMFEKPGWRRKWSVKGNTVELCVLA